MVSRHSRNDSAYVLERVHDVRLVFAFAELERQKMVNRRGPELGHRAVRIPASSTSKSSWLCYLSLPQLKVLQEVITLSVFAPFATLYMHQAIKLDYLSAGLCLLGSVYFMFRS